MDRGLASIKDQMTDPGGGDDSERATYLLLI
jgi:hypothetical protein